MTRTPTTALSEALIARCGERAATYDRENRFFTDDFKELEAAGFLKIAVPEQFGGRGLSLADVCREQRRLAYRAPATARPHSSASSRGMRHGRAARWEPKTVRRCAVPASTGAPGRAGG